MEGFHLKSFMAFDIAFACLFLEQSESVFGEKASLKSFMEADIASASKYYMVLERSQEQHRMYSQGVKGTFFWGASQD